MANRCEDCRWYHNPSKTERREHCPRCIHAYDFEIKDRFEKFDPAIHAHWGNMYDEL